MIEQSLDTRALDKAIRQAPDALARHLARGLARFGANYVDDFATERLGVADDRDAGDFLHRRPRTSEGLVNRSGKLARSLVARSAPAKRLADVELRMGFTDPLAARIARVHELGTVGKGGELPDIVPRRGRFLAVPVRGLGAALSAGASRVALLKKVAIPPRLGWRKRWQAAETVAAVDRMARTAGDDALREAAGGPVLG